MIERVIKYFWRL